MSSHFYRMATMDRIGCGRPAVDGTDFTWNIDEVTCGNCKRSKAFKAAVATREATATNLRALADYWRSRTDAITNDTSAARLVTVAPADAPCGWSANGETGTKLTCESGGNAVHILTATLPVAPKGTPLCGLHSPYDVTEADRQAVSDWRNGPRVIEYATTEEAYDAAMSDDTITDGTILMVRTEGVVGVLMNAWPVAVTAANGQFHHTINPPASGTDPSWDKAVSLAVALGFPLQFAERPALMDRIRALSERYSVGTTMVDDAGTSAEVTEVSKGMVWMRPDGGHGFIGFDVEHPGSWRTDMKIHTAENHEGALMAWGITTPGDNCSNPRMATCVVCRPELIAEDVETSAPFRTRSKVKNARQARRFRKGA